MTFFPKTQSTGGIVLAQMSAGEFRSEYVSSLTSWLNYDSLHNRRVLGPHGGFINMNSGPRIGAGRSDMVNTFLTTPELKSSEWLMMIDSDMTWEPDAVDRLVDTAEERDARVIGGLCFGARRYDGDMFPTVYKLVKDDHNRVTTDRIAGFPEEEPFTCDGTGAAFLLMHRSLLVDMSRPYPDGHGTLQDGTVNKLAWFAEVAAGPYDLGEDITFCMRLRAMGETLWVDPRVRTGHMKIGELNYSMWKER